MPAVFPGEIHGITLRELGNEIAKLSQDEEMLLEEVIAFEILITTRENEIDALNIELARYEVELEELGTEKEGLILSINKSKEILSEKIIYSYKYGNNEVAKFIISAKNLNEVVNNLFLFKNIMSWEADLIEELRYQKEELDRVSRKYEEKKMEKEITKGVIEKEKEKLRINIAESKVLLDKVKSEKSEMQDLIVEIKKRISEIQPRGITLVGEWEMVATAYYAFGSGGNDINGNGITATGLRARKGIVAVDPRVIPLGTRVFIPGYGEALAADTGGWIKGYRIDLCFETLEEAFRFGRRKIRVYLVEN
jgi:3D (Asp-Asp-Asp) domain-containing protein